MIKLEKKQKCEIHVQVEVMNANLKNIATTMHEYTVVPKIHNPEVVPFCVHTSIE